MPCQIASHHASRDLERGGGPCECRHCQGECDCEDEGGYDDEPPLVDPEEVGR